MYWGGKLGLGDASMYWSEISKVVWGQKNKFDAVRGVFNVCSDVFLFNSPNISLSLSLSLSLDLSLQWCIFLQERVVAEIYSVAMTERNQQALCQVCECECEGEGECVCVCVCVCVCMRMHVCVCVKVEHVYVCLYIKLYSKL